MVSINMSEQAIMSSTDNLRDLQIMCKDTVVLQYNYSTGDVTLFREDLLPFPLKNTMQELPGFESLKTPADYRRSLSVFDKNKGAFISWLGGRVLALSRANAKKIYQVLALPQSQDPITRAKISLVCAALSLQDNYWLRQEGDTTTWADVNLREVPLSKAVASVALKGTSLTIQNKRNEALHSPEISGMGAYAKAWVREDTGLYLHKAGDKGNAESRIEVMVSNLLDNCNVRHLKYEESNFEGLYTCRCRCMSTDKVSILHGIDFMSYCNRSGLNVNRELLRIDADSIYKMYIVDYLISNSDRHGQNWGLYYNSDTTEILCCHPLYDHNNAFDIDYMQNKDAEYIFAGNGISMRDAAKYAMKRTNFHFFREFTRDDFITDRQYKEFMYRAKELGIPIIPDKDTYVKAYDIADWSNSQGLTADRGTASLLAKLPEATVRDYREQGFTDTDIAYEALCTLRKICQ